jgi:tetratricopeptide (TPR) repeat protein
LLSVAEITDGLRDRFGMLRGSARDAPQRHRTLHAVVDWSWALLSPGARRALRRLSVLPGGFGLDAARHLLADAARPEQPARSNRPDLLDVLQELVDQSLLKRADGPAGVRFRMLETVREFAAAQRETEAETGSAIDGFLAWARAFGIARHETVLGSDSADVMATVRAETDNLLHAVRLALARDDGGTVAAAAAALAGLWTIQPANYPRLVALAEETGPVLSHLRPGPGLVEPLRTAVALFVATRFLMQGPRATRLLVAVRRLPPGRPDTFARAIATILADRAVLAGDLVALRAYADRPEPVLAAMANGILSYVLEGAGEAQGALKAAERMLEALRDEPGHPWIHVLAHSRIGELCLLADQPDRAREQFRIALESMQRLALPADQLQLQQGLALASLPLGDLEGAEHWLELAELSRNENTAGEFMLDLGVRAEILLARGETDAGLRQWRRAIDLMLTAEPSPFRVEERGLEPETLETEAVAVVAHARHGRLDEIAPVVEQLPGKLAAMLAEPLDRPPLYLVELPLCGALLRALAAVDIVRGATGSGARLMALAEAFRYSRGFQPTMSAEAARQQALDADATTYEAAVREYAGLPPQQLRVAALEVLRHRPAG